MFTKLTPRKMPTWLLPLKGCLIFRPGMHVHLVTMLRVSPSPDCEIEVVLRNAHSLGSEELKAAEHAFKTAMLTILAVPMGSMTGISPVWDVQKAPRIGVPRLRLHMQKSKRSSRMNPVRH